MPSTACGPHAGKRTSFSRFILFLRQRLPAPSPTPALLSEPEAQPGVIENHSAAITQRREKLKPDVRPAPGESGSSRIEPHLPGQGDGPETFWCCARQHESFERSGTAISSPSVRSTAAEPSRVEERAATTRVSGALREHGPEPLTQNAGGSPRMEAQAVFDPKRSATKRPRCCRRPPGQQQRSLEICVRGQYSAAAAPATVKGLTRRAGREPEAPPKPMWRNEAVHHQNWRLARRALLSAHGQSLPERFLRGGAQPSGKLPSTSSMPPGGKPTAQTS